MHLFFCCFLVRSQKIFYVLHICSCSLITRKMYSLLLFPAAKAFYIRNVCQCHTILYQLSGAEHCSFNLKTQWGKPLWSGSLEGATARITAFASVLLEMNGVRTKPGNAEIDLQICYGLSSLEVV